MFRMKLKVTVKRDDDKKPRQLEIQRGRKKLFLDYAYSPAGDLHSLEFTGRRSELPSIAEIMALVDKKRLDRIGTIELIDLISRITLIDKISLIDKITLIDDITTIGTIGEITTIRDVMSIPIGLIMNANFEQGLLNWVVTSNVEIVEVTGWIGHVCRFAPTAPTSAIDQNFAIALDPTWWNSFKFFLRCNTATTDCVRVYYYYFDGTSSNELFQVAVANTFELKSLSPTKAFQGIRILQENTALDTWFDNFFMVF